MEGGRGGGKSAALCWEAVRECLEAPGSNCLLLRRTLTATEKGGIEDYFLKFVPRHFYKGWNGQAHTAIFHNGSKLFFGHIKSDRDLAQYQSAEFLFIGFDELTQFTYGQWDYMKGSNRSPIKRYVVNGKLGPLAKARMAGATNPNGIGSGWVKALWITKRPPAGEMVLNYNPADYEAIHSTFEDNFVYRNDAAYLQGLISISDPILREAWIPGSWNILAGQYFQNFDASLDPVTHRYVGRHVRRLADIVFQSWQPVWIAIDWGFVHAAVVLWFTRALIMDGFGRERNVIVCYREYVTHRMNEEQLAGEIVARTATTAEKAEQLGHPVKENVERVFLSPDRFSRENSEHTIAETIGDILRAGGIPRPERANNDRVSGWRQIGTQFDTDGVVITDDCVDTLESIPKLQRDPKHLEDAIKEGNELHLDVCEALRYGMLSYEDAARIPRDILIEQKIKAIDSPTQKYMEYLRLTAQPAGGNLIVPIGRRRP